MNKQIKNLAPIGLSTYGRISHLKKTIEALKKNTLAKESELYIFSDAPKKGDEEKIAEVREYLRRINGFKKVHIVERKKNNRAYNNREGMKYLLDKYGKMIFMEEDIITAPGFLKFMNDALDFYKKNKQILNVSGYSVPIKIPSDYDQDIYFLKRFNAWGFGIWKDRFDEIMDDCDESKYNISFLNKAIIKKMKTMGDDIPAMVKMDMQGELDALDVKMMYQQAKKNLYTIHPRKSLVQNIGHDGSGLHCKKSDKFEHEKLWDKIDNFMYISTPKLNEFIVKENKKFRKIPMNENQLIFLISQPRSGSTLLQKILSAHSDICTRSEPWLMLYPLYSLKDHGISTEYDFELGKKGLKDFLSDLKDGKQSYIHGLRKMYLKLYSDYVLDTDCHYFLDKTPRYYLVYEELLQVFPDAKFILLIRNPLDVLGSIINTWSKNQWDDLSKFKKDLYEAIDKYIDIIDNKKDNFLLVHYEDLLKDSDNLIKEIFNYLGLEYEDVTNDYYKNNEKWNFGDQHNVYLKKGIDKKNSGKWENDLHKPQYWRVMNDYLNYIGKERFEKLGYNFEENKAILEENMPSESLRCINDKTKSLSELVNSVDNIFNIKKLKEEIFEKDYELERLNQRAISAENSLSISRNELSNIHSSYEWKLVLILHRIMNLIIPEKSFRRKIFIELWKLAGSFLQLSLGAYRGIRGAIFIVQNYFARYKPRKKRKINANSKKIVYIGHSYHNKTKSTVFLMDYLKEIFDVEVVLDESWLGKSSPDLSFIDESYLGVVFFQLLPSKEIIENIKNDNLIFFPMYDQSGRLGIDFWIKYRDLKIINFSKTLHKKLSKWRFESMYVQYFPKPQEFSPGKKDEVFFWQRLTKINVNTIVKFLKGENVKIHLHRAIDPWQKFIQPSQEDEKKFQITYSDWFETREEMHEVIKQKGIYVAPREYEGIGLSFLEAMAMGKAVIAMDNPTMNEYIENGKTGYLFNPKKLGKIDLSSIEQVQKNTYTYMQEGYKKWEKEKVKIIDFVKK